MYWLGVPSLLLINKVNAKLKICYAKYLPKEDKNIRIKKTTAMFVSKKKKKKRAANANLFLFQAEPAGLQRESYYDQWV